FLWFQVLPSLRMRVKHFQKPQRGHCSMISFKASITGVSLDAQSVLGLYNADREKPTILQALDRESWWSATNDSITARLAVGVRTFALGRP
ncbi:MAG: hypothetical protein EBS44_11110, partial [Betaproteobacteria bacterium]|nr:hypothetical protein [Betaproteobacteria bacterium]